MKKFVLAFLISLLISAISFSQSIHGVKIGYEVPSEGPFPTSLVFHGDTVIIVWQTTAIAGNVRIELRRKNHSLAAVIIPTYPFDDLPKAFQIPNSIAPGKYYIKVRQGNIFGNSSLFRIMGSRGIKWVNVFLEGKPYPKKGFRIGQTIAISWDTSHLLGQVTVLIKRGKSLSPIRSKPYIISKNRPAGDIPATFKIPNKTTPGNYIVEVRQGSIKAASKAFKIIKKLILPIKKKRIKLQKPRIQSDV